jgi:hypothetical protein
MVKVYRDSDCPDTGVQRWRWIASLGQGTRVGWRNDEDAAQQAGGEAERALLLIESHDPGNGQLPAA